MGYIDIAVNVLFVLGVCFAIAFLAHEFKSAFVGVDRLMLMSQREYDALMLSDAPLGCRAKSLHNSGSRSGSASSGMFDHSKRMRGSTQDPSDGIGFVGSGNLQ